MSKTQLKKRQNQGYWQKIRDRIKGERMAGGGRGAGQSK